MTDHPDPSPEAAQRGAPLLGRDQDELEALLRELREPGFRAKQLCHWLYERRTVDPQQMSNLPKGLREALSALPTRALPRTLRVEGATDESRKLLFELHDGQAVEGVLIPLGDKEVTLCVSSQVGCPLDCRYCRTGTMGLRRNLEAGEILGQVVEAQRLLPPDVRLRRLVFMGMGEPLLNLPAVSRALRLLQGPRRMGFGPGRITVSTAGIPRGLAQLRGEHAVRLAISLGGASDAQRARLMPAASRVASLHELLDACRGIELGSREHITLELVMVRGVNDRDSDARALVAATRGLRCKFNLIPLNEHSGTPLRASPEGRIRSFQRVLVRGGRPTSIRRSKGAERLAACGQLATGTRGR